MESESTKTQDAAEELQKQTRELLRAQQESYIAAVKAWREAMAAGIQPPPWPHPPPPLDKLPTLTEAAQASYAFAAKLLADQSRFLEELSEAMAAPDADTMKANAEKSSSKTKNHGK
jgi:hypothetical protein